MAAEKASPAGPRHSEPAPTVRTRLRSSVLVGRDEQLRDLASALSTRPTIVVITGEAGVGKTRLIEEVLERPPVQPDRVLLGHCYPLRDPFPLGPVIEALRPAAAEIAGTSTNPLLGALRPVLPEVAELLPPKPESLGDAASEKLQLYAAVIEALTSVGACTCVLEDLQWADDTTLDFLRVLIVQSPPHLRLIVTYRPQDVEDSSPLRSLVARVPSRVARAHIELPRLTRQETELLVASIFDTSGLSREFTSYLYERTSGLPFAVEEVLRLLHTRRDLIQQNGAWSRRAVEAMEVPSAIRDTILQRLHELEPTARSTVEAASVLGAAHGKDVIALVARIEPNAAVGALSRAVSSALLRETANGDYEFEHDLARQAIYEGIPGAVRSMLHLRAADAIRVAGSSEAGRLAHHYRLAGRSEWIQWAEEAADVAIGLGDYAKGASFLAEVLTEGNATREHRIEIAAKVGDAALQGLLSTQAVPLVRQVLREPIEPHLRGELRILLGLLLCQAGDASSGAAEVRSALEDVKDDPVLHIRALRMLSVPWVAEGTLSEHFSWLEEASTLAKDLGEEEITTSVEIDRMTLLVATGDLGGLEIIDRLASDQTSAIQERELGRACHNAGDVLYLGHYRMACDYLELGRQRSKALGYERFAGADRISELVIQWSMGDWTSLETQAQDAIVLASDYLWHQELDTILGLLYLSRGDIDAAEETLEKALTDTTRGGLIPVAAMAAAGLARLRLAQNDVEAAVNVLETCLDAICRKQIWVWAAEVAPLQAKALLLLGRGEDARKLTAAFAEGIRGKDAPLAHAASVLCHAHVMSHHAEPLEWRKAYESAAHQYQVLPRPFDAALVREDLGVLGLARGDRMGAEAALAALEGYSELGATWDATRARHLLRQHGIPIPTGLRAAPPRRGGALSAREQEVADLAAQGFTNKEIAARLFLSPRTVAHHLERAMHKLDISSRKELAPPVRTAI